MLNVILDYISILIALLSFIHAQYEASHLTSVFDTILNDKQSEIVLCPFAHGILISYQLECKTPLISSLILPTLFIFLPSLIQSSITKKSEVILISLAQRRTANPRQFGQRASGNSDNFTNNSDTRPNGRPQFHPYVPYMNFRQQFPFSQNLSTQRRRGIQMVWFL